MSAIQMPRRRGLLLTLLSVLLLVSAALPALAQDEAAPIQRTEQEINDLALDMQIRYMSPYCPGSNLRDCTSGKAAVLRGEIRDWIAEGRSEKWIEDELVARHGESILSAPRFKGFNMLVWIFPVLAVLIGLGLIFAYLQRQSSMAVDQTVPGRLGPNDTAQDPALSDRLERELTARSR